MEAAGGNVFLVAESTKKKAKAKLRKLYSDFVTNGADYSVTEWHRKCGIAGTIDDVLEEYYGYYIYEVENGDCFINEAKQK